MSANLKRRALGIPGPNCAPLFLIITMVEAGALVLNGVLGSGGRMLIAGANLRLATYLAVLLCAAFGG